MQCRGRKGGYYFKHQGGREHRPDHVACVYRRRGSRGMWHRALVVEARQVFVLEEPINNVALSTVISFHLVVEQEVAAECIRNLSYLF